MGKLGKQRKRRKLDQGHLEEIGGEEDIKSEDDTDNGVSEEDIITASALLESLYFDFRERWASKEAKPLRTALFPLILLQQKAHFEIIPPKTGRQEHAIEPREMALLKRVATHFAGSEEGKAEFATPACRPYRRALHPFVVMHFSAQTPQSATDHEEDRSFSGRISNAFRANDWPGALRLLHDMSRSGEVLKLGALQRWVRDCDLALTVSGDRNASLLLLDATMRVGEMNAVALKQPLREKDLFKISSPPTITTKCIIETFPPFSPPLFVPLPPVYDAEQQQQTEASAFSVVHSVPGSERKPPSPFPLNIYSTAPDTIDLSSTSSSSERRRFDVPGVPGAILMTNILSSRECRRIIDVAETIGFKPDAIDNIDNIVWLADESLLQPMFERCRPLLPQTMGPDRSRLMGLNARLRLFRYFPGAVYRPHIDGAWPGSGIHPKTGAYTDDVFTDQADKRYSKLTFLVYLNDIICDSPDGDVGGSTTFFLPDADLGFGHIQARGVVPRCGNVLAFPHGDVLGSLVHEGSEVAAGGKKYIIRTDVLYTVPGVP